MNDLVSFSETIMFIYLQAGVLAIREKHKLSLSRDNPSQLAKLLASQKPMFKPSEYIVIL